MDKGDGRNDRHRYRYKCRGWTDTGMHVEEVDRNRQREDDRQGHMEIGQRQACRFCIAEE